MENGWAERAVWRKQTELLPFPPSPPPYFIFSFSFLHLHLLLVMCFEFAEVSLFVVCAHVGEKRFCDYIRGIKCLTFELRDLHFKKTVFFNVVVVCKLQEVLAMQVFSITLRNPGERVLRCYALSHKIIFFAHFKWRGTGWKIDRFSNMAESVNTSLGVHLFENIQALNAGSEPFKCLHVIYCLCPQIHKIFTLLIFHSI